MPRFAHMLKSSFEQRGHAVTMWSPVAQFQRLFAASKFSKWAGYVDQYVLFPLRVRTALKSVSADTLFVFCDQALGPWVPLVKTRPHVVHAHDLLALRSALGDIRENPTSFTGRIYQRYIRRGFKKARHFISVSEKTREDLHRFGQVAPLSSEVVYNGMNFPYKPMPTEEAQAVLRAAGFPDAPHGMLLHVGGSQWYKNTAGLISLYAQYAVQEAHPLPLWCIGPTPRGEVARALSKVPGTGRVLFFQNVANLVLQAAYSTARAFLFPSLAEGFGWPLIEAQACGCPVITTNVSPMTEVAGDAAFYLPRLEHGGDVDAWASHAATILRLLLSESADGRAQRTLRGRAWAARFDSDQATAAYLAIYQRVLNSSSGRTAPELASW
jgi:glycosyltransferase involved in cell wall biosynthesis